MRRRLVLVGLGASLVAGCDVPARLASLPEKLRGSASFHGLPKGTRVLTDGSDDALMGHMARESLRRELAYAERTGAKSLGPATYLAISGGGENGAYGAGLLTGWSALGTRPEFKVVTGVSTGALIAPFAFLGPAYDRELERFYTATGKKDVMASNGLVAAALGESLYDSTPLLHTIRSVLTPTMMADIAREYTEKGRLLCIATTNLDVPVGVLWDIGAIAASGHRDAAELVAKILLASASIPGAFPPVMIDLEAGGEHFQEMHVDGGTVSQVAFYPPSFAGDDLLVTGAGDAVRLRRTVRDRPRRLYVIRNARPGADIETVDRSTVKIASRAVSTLIATQGIGDLYQLYVLAQRDHIDFNVAWIPASFGEKAGEPFETGYMNRLYRVGRAAIADGTAWSKYPPGYDPTPLTQIGPAAG
ncbi:MAG: patatin-like phospholipase family protein [Reyranella sp.]|uniref:patatin-like phospholipase family protein n=1 Tax=Reyranella sp. TaxID=1929291 RepID=UPI001AC01B97|nr:patatin-like phospholipase family protein [Reyranella sp.]MBN9091630.1 patatin-like phospholipase family protein [Reyranella sp.]